MQQDILESLTASVREVLTAPPARVQELLTELGWDDVVADEPDTATTILFTEHGRLLGLSPILDRVTLAALGDPPEQLGAVCYPLGDDLLAVDALVQGILLQPPAPGTLVAVPVLGPNGTPRVAVVPADSLEVEHLSSFDGDLTWCRATGPAPTRMVEGADWPQAQAAARRALSAELIGVSHEALRLAADHTSTRVQFGHPIAAFQAVRHRLAEAYVAVTAAEAVLAAAWADGGTFAAAAAKAQAGRAHALVIRHAVQVCGAMGASLEHPLHRYVARGVALDALLGTSRALTQELGEEVLATGETPRLAHV